MSKAAGHEQPRKRRRLVNCCEACRVRHLKCDLQTPSCRQCDALGIECVRQVNVRFRDVSRSVAGDFESHIWLESASQLSFVDESAAIASLYEDGGSNKISIEGEHSGLETSQSETLGHHQHVLESSKRPPRTIAPLQKMAQAALPSPLVNESPGSLDSSSFGIASPSTVLRPILPFTPREAELLRHYSENMALWADTTDLERHFELEVPRRALSNRILRYAIFAFASRHMNRHASGDWAEAVQYHNHCLELLIPFLSSEHFTDEMFTAITILRLFEELDIVEDKRFHLAGATKILNSLPSLSSGGGLGEAAAWLCLRQDIYISLVHQQPLRTQLQSFDRSTAFTSPSLNDPAWTNRIVFHVARILSVAFLERSTVNTETLRRVDLAIDEWNGSKPSTFAPIKFIPRGLEADRRLPVIWMLSPFHVLALQYYHIAKILLLTSKSSDHILEYAQVQQSRRVEKNIRDHLLIILGLAASNQRAENTIFEAKHSLSVWGGVLKHPLDLMAARQFLINMEAKTGFSVGKTLQNLEAQWKEDNEHIE